MLELESQKGLIDEAVVQWRRLSIGQKKYILVMSVPVSIIVLVVVALVVILAWSGGLASTNYMFGNPSDGYLNLVYLAICNALDHWWVALTPLVTTPSVLAYIEYKSRHSPS